MRPLDLIQDLWLLFFVVWLLGALRTKPVVKRQPMRAMLTQRILTIAVWLLLLWPRAAVGVLGWRFVKQSVGVAWAGVAITAAGVAIAFWARATLGGNWSAEVTVKAKHELVIRGPYAFVRHPIYSGISLAVAGTALAWGDVRGLVALVTALVAWRLKWPMEEQFMLEEFGERYADYRRRVSAIIPGIW